MNINKNDRIAGMIMLIIGIILLVWPGATLSAFSRFLGCIMLIVGVAEVIMGIKGTRPPANTAWGTVAAILGVLFIWHPQVLLAVLPVVIGIVVAAAGVMLLVRVITGRMEGTAATMQLIGGAITLVVGLILIFHPIAAVKFLMVIVGVVLIYYGILRLGRSY